MTDTPITPFFNITLLTPDNYDKRIEWAQVIEQEFPKIGIGVKYHDIAPRKVIDEERLVINPETGMYNTYDEGGFDIITDGLMWGFNLQWDAYQEVYPYITYEEGYQSPGMDELMPIYYSTFNNTKRLETLKQIQATLHEDQPEIVILYPAGIWAFNPSWDILYEDVLAIQFYRMRSGWADFGFNGYDPIVFGRIDPGPYTTINFETLFQDFEWGYFFTVIPSMIWQGLYERNQTDNFNWVPLIAKQMPIWSEDNKLATIILRDDVFFADGHQLTSHDVVETYRFHLTPSYSPFSYGVFNYFFGFNESIIAIDDFTVQFNFTEAIDDFPYPLEFFDYGILPIHIWGNHTHPAVADYNFDAALAANMTKLYEFCIGTGPYRYKFVNMTEPRVELQAVNNYWNGDVQTNEIHFEIYEYDYTKGYCRDEDQAIADLQSGKTHILGRNIIQNLSKVQGLDYYVLPNSNLIPGEMDTPIQELFLNLYHPILGTGVKTPLGITTPSRAGEAAKYIRQAISHVIPRQRIIDEILLGVGIPGLTLVNPICLGFDDSLEPYEYNIAKAKELLTKAGYKYPPEPSTTSSTTSTTSTISAANSSFELMILIASMTSFGIYNAVKHHKRRHQK
ncbi:MAG: ABC transporter substrate-binding protein [Promethearchaeota archaeon]